MVSAIKLAIKLKLISKWLELNVKWITLKALL